MKKSTYEELESNLVKSRKELQVYIFLACILFSIGIIVLGAIMDIRYNNLLSENQELKVNGTSLYSCLDKIMLEYGDVALFDYTDYANDNKKGYNILVYECKGEYCKPIFYVINNNCEVLE